MCDIEGRWRTDNGAISQTHRVVSIKHRIDSGRLHSLEPESDARLAKLCLGQLVRVLAPRLCPVRHHRARLHFAPIEQRAELYVSSADQLLCERFEVGLGLLSRPKRSEWRGEG